LDKDGFREADAVTNEKMKESQHLYHIMEPNDIPFSKSPACRRLRQGRLSAGKLDFPRTVKLKSRKKPMGQTTPKAARASREYADFPSFIEEGVIGSSVGMDTVTSRLGGKTIMTLHFTNCNFMSALLLDNKTAAEAASKISGFKGPLAANGLNFGDIFPVLLTGNGAPHVAALGKALAESWKPRCFFAARAAPAKSPRWRKTKPFAGA